MTTEENTLPQKSKSSPNKVSPYFWSIFGAVNFFYVVMTLLGVKYFHWAASFGDVHWFVYALFLFGNGFCLLIYYIKFSDTETPEQGKRLLTVQEADKKIQQRLAEKGIIRVSRGRGKHAVETVGHYGAPESPQKNPIYQTIFESRAEEHYYWVGIRLDAPEMFAIIHDPDNNKEAITTAMKGLMDNPMVESIHISETQDTFGNKTMTKRVTPLWKEEKIPQKLPDLVQ